MQGGRIRKLPIIIHILALARNLISVSKMDDAGVKKVFKKDGSGSTRINAGVWIRTI